MSPGIGDRPQGGGNTTFLRPGEHGQRHPGRPKGVKDLSTILTAALRAAQRQRVQLREPCSCFPEHMPTLRVKESLRDYQARCASWMRRGWARSCQTLDAHFARQAFLDPAILIAFQKKRIPDLQHQTVEGDRHPTVINVIHAYRDAGRRADADPGPVRPHADGRGQSGASDASPHP